MSVLLPEPVGPMTATHSPRLTEKSMSFNTWRSPKTLQRPRTSIISAPALTPGAASGWIDTDARWYSMVAFLQSQSQRRGDVSRGRALSIRTPDVRAHLWVSRVYMYVASRPSLTRLAQPPRA